MSLNTMNTHFQHTLFEQYEDTVYSMVNPDQHDRILTDPAYRIQKQM